MNAFVYAMNGRSRSVSAPRWPHGRVVFQSLDGVPVREYFLYIPHGAGSTSPIVVLVHGIARNAAEHVFRFRSVAEQAGVILVAPLFSSKSYGQYQQVVDRDSGVRADLALFDILETVATETAAPIDSFYLFGFSGGAQFAHRLMMLHPQRIAAVAVAAAGWYTLPHSGLRYPFGIASNPIPGGCFDPEAFLAVPRHVLVGDQDVSRDESLRRTRKLDRLQGKTRLARARSWFDAMEHSSHERAVCVAPGSFTLLPGTAHNFTEATERHGLAETVFRKFHLLPIDRKTDQ